MRAIGIILIVAGAMIAWGVDAFANGFDFQAVGYLMMGGGAIASIFAALSGVGSTSVNRAGTRTEQRVVPDDISASQSNRRLSQHSA